MSSAVQDVPKEEFNGIRNTGFPEPLSLRQSPPFLTPTFGGRLTRAQQIETQHSPTPQRTCLQQHASRPPTSPSPDHHHASASPPRDASRPRVSLTPTTSTRTSTTSIARQKPSPGPPFPSRPAPSQTTTRSSNRARKSGLRGKQIRASVCIGRRKVSEACSTTRHEL